MLVSEPPVDIVDHFPAKRQVEVAANASGLGETGYHDKLCCQVQFWVVKAKPLVMCADKCFLACLRVAGARYIFFRSQQPSLDMKNFGVGLQQALAEGYADRRT